MTNKHLVWKGDMIKSAVHSKAFEHIKLFIITIFMATPQNGMQITNLYSFGRVNHINVFEKNIFSTREIFTLLRRCNKLAETKIFHKSYEMSR